MVPILFYYSNTILNISILSLKHVTFKPYPKREEYDNVVWDVVWDTILYLYSAFNTHIMIDEIEGNVCFVNDPDLNIIMFYTLVTQTLYTTLENISL